MQIVTLVIEHKNGMNLYPCATEALAKLTLYAWVTEYWQSETPMPESQDEAIRVYFEENGYEESWFLSEDELIETEAAAVA